MSALYVGLMSGTSMDGIDAVLVDLSGSTPRLLDAQTYPWPGSIKSQMMQVAQGELTTADALAQLDAEVGSIFAEAALQVVSGHANPETIRAIGSHGQTVAHNPDAKIGYTLQIGNPGLIAEKTQISTVADFRSRDIAAGGQGAPLVSAFHQAVFRHSEENRVVLNIGGIANVTWLPADKSEAIQGFDTGPGNCLMDVWARRHLDQHYDADGEFARQGQNQPALLNPMLDDGYFLAPPPKSTGTDYFSADWLDNVLAKYAYPPEDVQATLLQLTVRSIAKSIQQHYPAAGRVLVCGGGCHNAYLMAELAQHLACPVQTTEKYGAHPDWVEGMAFAWLADRYLQALPGNVPSVSGSRGSRILGALYPRATT